MRLFRKEERSEPRLTEEETLRVIRSRLASSLGNNYEVLFPDQLSNREIQPNASRPDLVVRNKQTRSLTALEVQETGPSHALPLATAPMVGRIRDSLKGRDAQAVLITGSRVSPALRAYLDKERVGLVEETDSDKLVTHLTEIISSHAR